MKKELEKNKEDKEDNCRRRGKVKEEKEKADLDKGTKE